MIFSCVWFQLRACFFDWGLSGCVWSWWEKKCFENFFESVLTGSRGRNLKLGFRVRRRTSSCGAFDGKGVECRGEKVGRLGGRNGARAFFLVVRGPEAWGKGR